MGEGPLRTAHAGSLRRADVGKEVRLANEEEFGAAFPDCDLGAAPPFGGLYGLPVYLDRGLLTAATLVFAAGSPRHSMHLSLAAYREAAHPTAPCPGWQGPAPNLALGASAVLSARPQYP